jgi:hypothetical protein
MLAHLVSGRWGEAAERSHPANTSPEARRGWFSRLIAALFGKSR